MQERRSSGGWQAERSPPLFPSGDYVYVADPIRGNIRIPNWEFIEQWQKNAILVVAKPGEKVKQFTPLSLTEADVGRGELNKQIIRSQESRQPPRPALLSH